MKSRTLIWILLITSLAISISNIHYSMADSGWDTSYDGGSYSSSDLDLSSSNHNSNSYSSSSKSTSPSYPLSYLDFKGWAIVILCVLAAGVYIFFQYSLNKGIKFKKIVIGLSNKKVQSFGISRKDYNQMVYDKFVLIQEAWMNFDYEALKNLVTDELYNTYVAQLEVLKLKERQNIMSDFKLLKSKIIKITNKNGIISVTSYLNVKMYDYVVNSKNDVVRGSDIYKMDVEYEITFVKDANDKKIKTCPSCGGKLNNTTREKCEHCGNIIVKSLDSFVMSKKTNIGQRMV